MDNNKDKDSKQSPFMEHEHRLCSALNRGSILLPSGAITSFPVAERLRMIRAKIERANLSTNQFQVLAISSALPQEGKSVISSNLSRALGIDPQGKTLLIDCDLRKPSVHKFFDFRSEPGLSDAILGGATPSDVIRPIGPGLDVVTAGTPSFDPTQIIEQPKFQHFVESMRANYRYIILDCPPVLLCSEPITLASMADGMIMVIRAWRTEKRLLKDAIETIGKHNVFGVVLNEGHEVSRQYSYYSYYGYRRELVTGVTSHQNPMEPPKGTPIQ